MRKTALTVALLAVLLLPAAGWAAPRPSSRTEGMAWWSTLVSWFTTVVWSSNQPDPGEWTNQGVIIDPSG